MSRTFFFFVTSLWLLSNNFVSSQSLKSPQFPGGEPMLAQYLNQNLKWPKSDQGDSQGIVVISFFVEKNGVLTDIKVTKSMAAAFDAEALKVVVNSPKWIPATRDGKPIRSRYTLPIKFFIERSKE